MEDFKVLLVDDEEDFIRVLSERMELRDMKPEVALDGEEALKKVEAEAPTVIVLDLKMPGMTAWRSFGMSRRPIPRPRSSC